MGKKREISTEKRAQIEVLKKGHVAWMFANVQFHTHSKELLITIIMHHESDQADHVLQQ